VLLHAGGQPMLVRREVERGAFLVFLPTAMGKDRPDAFWNWVHWPALLHRLLADPLD